MVLRYELGREFLAEEGSWLNSNFRLQFTCFESIKLVLQDWNQMTSEAHHHHTEQGILLVFLSISFHVLFCQGLFSAFPDEVLSQSVNLWV
jgi:hypothetical protein